MQIQIPKLPNPLKRLLCQDGFIIFIEGKKEKGKTNFAMLLNELCQGYGYRKHFATNIKCQSDFMEKITNYPDLENWLEKMEGKKTYTLDEAGKHLKRMRFMTEQNTRILDLCQLIRHYDGGFIGIAPSSKFVDNNFLNTDILDARVRKISKQDAIVIDYFNDDAYFIHDIPRTSIRHNSKDIAIFTMEKKIDVSKFPLCCQVAKAYADTQSYRMVGEVLGLHDEQIKREIIKHLKHSLTHDSRNNHEENCKQISDL